MGVAGGDGDTGERLALLPMALCPPLYTVKSLNTNHILLMPYTTELRVPSAFTTDKEIGRV